MEITETELLASVRRRGRCGSAPRYLAALTLAPLLAACVAGAKNAVNVTGAYRALSGDVQGTSVSPTIGLEGLWGVSGDGIGLEGGFLYSDASDPDTEDDGLESNELYAGVRKTWNTSGEVQPYFAGGANWITGGATDPFDNEFSGNNLGAYVRAGVGFQLGLFQLGADLRASLTNADAGDENLSYVQGALFLGFSF